MNRKSEVILSILMLLVVSMIIVSIDGQTTSKANTEKSDQKDFYTMTENPLLADILMPDTLDDLMIGTNLIIVGEVISTDESEMSHQAQPGSAEFALQEKGKQKN